MKSDNINNTMKIQEKKLKTYRITEKEYAQARRDRERLLEIKKHIRKVVKITSQVK